MQGLEYIGFDNYGEMEQLIQEHCTKQGVQITFLKIIPTKYDREQVGCKLAVREEDAELVMSESFWPEFATVREWVRRPKNGNGYGEHDGYGH